MFRGLGITALALAAPLASAAGQQRMDGRFSSARLEAPRVAETLEPLALEAGPAASRESGVSWRSVAHAVGGALLGGWVGYVGSQVIKDDWEKDSNGSFRNHRSLMAATGALLGMVGSRLIGDTRSPVEGVRPVARHRADRRLTAEEIRASNTRNAYELITTLRGHWLVVRGLHSHTEAAQGFGAGEVLVVQPGADKILVYVDDIRLGGVATLRDISTDLLTGATFLDAREATYRYGTGHTHGAILLSTEVSAP